MWDVEGISFQSFSELTIVFCLLQVKGRREFEGFKSCRSFSGRFLIRVEKRMSFESVFFLLEVSGQQWKGMVQRCREQIFRFVGGVFRYEFFRWVCGDRNFSFLRIFVFLGGLFGLWVYRSRRFFLWIRRRFFFFAQFFLLRGIVSGSGQILDFFVVLWRYKVLFLLVRQIFRLCLCSFE